MPPPLTPINASRQPELPLPASCKGLGPCALARPNRPPPAPAAFLRLDERPRARRATRFTLRGYAADGHKPLSGMVTRRDVPRPLGLATSIVPPGTGHRCLPRFRSKSSERRPSSEDGQARCSQCPNVLPAQVFGEEAHDALRRRDQSFPPSSRSACQTKPGSTDSRAPTTARDFVALAGDCNVEIPCYLKTLTVDWRRYAAVFAMVDQYSGEVTWETPKYLSTWRLNRRGFKVGPLLYLGHGLLRGLPGLAGRQLLSSAVRSRVSQVRAAWRSPSSSS